jgi:hypothetical protein
MEAGCRQDEPQPPRSPDFPFGLPFRDQFVRLLVDLGVEPWRQVRYLVDRAEELGINVGTQDLA